ncbi:MAG: hypothetical protein QM652_09085 [Legionella sp.]|uniref:hypothetical protein n=1 Tax=Legionella sp. TaxID=459 RepID=UPI0039E2FC00
MLQFFRKKHKNSVKEEDPKKDNKNKENMSSENTPLTREEEKALEETSYGYGATSVPYGN